MVDEWSNEGFVVSFKVRFRRFSPFRFSFSFCLHSSPSRISSLVPSLSLCAFPPTSSLTHYILPSQLETDPSILIPKARAALTRYGHQIVVGNLLETRKHEVVFVTPSSPSSSGEEWLRIAKDGKKRDGEVHEIEEDIVERLAGLHGEWVGKGERGKDVAV